METKNYFQHDYRSRDDKKLLRVRMKHKMLGVGIYWCLVELLHEGNGYIENDTETLSFQLQEDEEIIKDVIQICFITEGDKIYCNRVIENLQFREEKRKQASEDGKKGAEKRWGKKGVSKGSVKGSDTHPIPTLYQRYSEVMGSDSIEKEKEKEIDKDKETEIYKEIYTDQAISIKPKYKKILDGLNQVENKQLFNNSWEDMLEVGFDIISENNEWSEDVYNNWVNRINNNFVILNG